MKLNFPCEVEVEVHVMIVFMRTDSDHHMLMLQRGVGSIHLLLNHNITGMVLFSQMESSPFNSLIVTLTQIRNFY